MTYIFGLDTFGDRNSDADGKPLSHAQTIRNVAEEGVFAEQAGVDFFGIGEHHTEYFPMPAGDVVLAAIAARTERIRLGSAVTMLSSDDPVRSRLEPFRIPNGPWFPCPQGCPRTVCHHHLRSSARSVPLVSSRRSRPGNSVTRRRRQSRWSARSGSARAESDEWRSAAHPGLVAGPRRAGCTAPVGSAWPIRHRSGGQHGRARSARQAGPERLW